MSRETRLLVLVIVVSVVLLVVLARFRFPATDRTAPPAGGPLERLAARATFDDLAATIADVSKRVAGGLIDVELRVGAGAGVEAGASAGAAAAGDAAAGEARRDVAALRVAPDAALLYVPAGARVVAIDGVAGPPAVVAVDPVRHLGLVRVPASPDAPVAPLDGSAPNVAGPRYVAAIEGTRGGPVARPLYLGRADLVGDDRWSSPVIALGGAPETAGAFVFTFDGQLIGLAIDEDGGTAIVPPDALQTALTALQHGPPPSPVDPGFDWQPLTPRLGAALGASRGVVVTDVASNGPASRLLRPGDVITDVNGQPLQSATSLVAQLSAPSVHALSLAIRRGSAVLSVTVPLIAPAPRPAASDLGASLATVGGRGVRVSDVQSGGPAEAAGLRDGDLIVHAGDRGSPTVDQLIAAWRAAAPQSWLVVVVDRGGRREVAALRKP